VARKLIEYSDVGSTVGAVNFPQVTVPRRTTGMRILQVHQNVPGMLGRLNEVFARSWINIAAHCCQTDNEIGYVVVEAEAMDADGASVPEEIAELGGTTRARLLYEKC
jgi:D-3-phosphoglycerate dehydrogenase / 2-oxoglutarate reductase